MTAAAHFSRQVGNLNFKPRRSTEQYSTSTYINLSLSVTDTTHHQGGNKFKFFRTLILFFYFPLFHFLPGNPKSAKNRKLTFLALSLPTPDNARSYAVGGFSTGRDPANGNQLADGAEKRL